MTYIIGGIVYLVAIAVILAWNYAAHRNATDDELCKEPYSTGTDRPKRDILAEPCGTARFRSRTDGSGSGTPDKH